MSGLIFCFGVSLEKQPVHQTKAALSRTETQYTVWRSKSDQPIDPVLFYCLRKFCFSSVMVVSYRPMNTFGNELSEKWTSLSHKVLKGRYLIKSQCARCICHIMRFNFSLLHCPYVQYRFITNCSPLLIPDSMTKIVVSNIIHYITHFR